MKPAHEISAIAAALLIGCSAPPARREPQRPAVGYRELRNWEIPPSPEGQPHGLQGIAADERGQVYVADAEGRRIVVCSMDGRILREIKPPRRPAGLLQMPFGILYDGRGRLYVTDYAADQIQIFTTGGKFLGRWGREGSGPGEFRAPVGIAQDGHGNFYVVEFYNHRFQKFSRDGAFVFAWGEKAEWNLRHSPQEPPEKLLYPTGIAVGPDGDIYIADSGRDKIKVVSPEGKFLRQFGSKSPEPGKFTALSGIAFDAEGRLHEADMGAHRVQMFTKEGKFLAAWSLPDAARQKIDSPTQVFPYPPRFLFVSDVANNRIYQLQIEEAHQP